MTEAQQRATAAWRERHNLRRVELLVPEDTLFSIDAAAADRGISRTRVILDAVAQALGSPRQDSQTGDPDQLAAIEAKLDMLLKAAETGPISMPDHIPDSTGPKHGLGPGLDPRLEELVREYRGQGMPWGSVADVLNDRGILSPRPAGAGQMPPSRHTAGGTGSGVER